MKATRRLAEALKARTVLTSGGCMEYTGSRLARGYGVIGIDQGRGKQVLAPTGPASARSRCGPGPHTTTAPGSACVAAGPHQPHGSGGRRCAGPSPALQLPPTSPAPTATDPTSAAADPTVSAAKTRASSARPSTSTPSQSIRVLPPRCGLARSNIRSRPAPFVSVWNRAGSASGLYSVWRLVDNSLRAIARESSAPPAIAFLRARPARLSSVQEQESWCPVVQTGTRRAREPPELLTQASILGFPQFSPTAR